MALSFTVMQEPRFVTANLNITPAIRYEISRADAELRESETRSCNFVVGSLGCDQIYEIVGSTCNSQARILSKPGAPLRNLYYNYFAGAMFPTSAKNDGMSGYNFSEIR